MGQQLGKITYNWPFKFLDHLPKVPQEFVDLAAKDDPNLLGEAYSSSTFEYGKDPIYTRKLTGTDGNPVTHVGSYRYRMPEPFVNWCQENITRSGNEWGCSISNREEGALGPHTDRSRDFALLYVVEPGGADVRTTFWQEHGHPLVRERFLWRDDYRVLDLVEAADFGVGRWVLINSLVLHSVDHLERHRITFQLSLEEDISEFI
jgi:hypothetical protein